jgi:glycosyltransferase involved in cell wall biosynthesis
MIPRHKAEFDDAANPVPRFEQVAVVLPCLNEVATVGGVVAAFKSVLPGAAVFVIDNGSVDGTRETAKRAGAHVIAERQRGKGNAVRRAFAAIDADI